MSDQVDEVREWLKGHGDAFEFEVAEAFNKAGFDDVALGPYIAGGEAEGEVDVLATMRCDHDSTDRGTAQIRCQFLCECKYLRQGSWALIDGNRSLSPWDCLTYTPHFVPRDPVHTEGIARWWQERLAVTTLQGELPPARNIRHMPVSGREHGKEVRRATSRRRRDRDCPRPEPYAIVQRVTRLAWAAVTEGVDPLPFTPLYSYVFPCVVIDGSLWRAAYKRGQQGMEPVPEQIAEGKLLWAACEGGTLVHVVTKQALAGFATRAHAFASTVLEMLHNLRDVTLEEERRRR